MGISTFDLPITYQAPGLGDQNAAALIARLAGDVQEGMNNTQECVEELQGELEEAYRQIARLNVRLEAAEFFLDEIRIWWEGGYLGQDQQLPDQPDQEDQPDWDLASLHDQEEQ